MAEHSTIEWTDATWNPITGCTLVSEGCRHCYAATLAATRLKHHPSRAGLARINAHGEAKFTGEVRLNEQWLDQPLRWKRPRMIFVCAHGDLFHENVPDEWIDRVFAVMALCPQHTFQVLTKRPERAREYLNELRPIAGPNEGQADSRFHIAHTAPLDDPFFWDVTDWPLQNVWLGTSVEDQATADARIPHLLATPAAVRFVSAEPLLGPVDIAWHLTVKRWGIDWADEVGPGSEWGDIPALDWVIVGGESGRHARPMHPDWARSLRDQCFDADVAFFFKQWGEWAPVEIDEDKDDGTVGPAYPMLHCTSDYTAHEGEKECRFWQGERMAHWPLIETLPAIGARRIGKKAAGRLLDARIWGQMPGALT